MLASTLVPVEPLRRLAASALLALTCAGWDVQAASAPPVAPPAQRTPPEPPPPPTPPAPASAPSAQGGPADPLSPTRPDLAGVWAGEAVGARGALYLLVGFTRDAQGAWTIVATVPQALAVNQRVSQASVTDGRRFEGELTSATASVKLRGELAADGSRVDGEAEVASQGMPPQLRSFTLRPTAHPRQVAERTTWSTRLQVPGAALDMQMTLADAGPLGWVGSMDIPAQGLVDFPVLVKRRGSGTFDVTVPVANPATMVLEPSADGTTLAGTFAQGITVPVTFTRDAGVLAAARRRPQDPVPPYPYREREVLIQCEGGHVLAGTLLLPPGASPDAKVGGVVLLTGSGAQDRNESLMGHRPFLVIADALARAGLAVLRCDDRGVGGSTGASSAITSEDLAEDARCMLKHLRSHAEVDPGLCGLVGHSEGGLTGPMAAVAEQEAGRPLAFLVMLAGPGVTGRELLKTQMRRIIEAEGVQSKGAGEVLDRQARLLDAVVAGMPDEELRGMVTALINAQLTLNATAAGLQPPPPLGPEAPLVATSMAQLTSPWMRTFLALDPRDSLAQLKCPVLAMNGTLDTQVDVDQNLTEVERIRSEAGLPVTARRLEGLNHLFQPARSGAVAEYATIDVTFEPAALADMVAWIRATVDSLAATRPPPFRPVRLRDRAAP